MLIVETEFLLIAEKLKPHVKRRMKIEPFPWLRDYYIDMNKLYTELTLERIKNTILGVEGQRIENYEQIFHCDSDSESDWETEEEYSADESSVCLEIEPENDTLNGKKILLKGDPGMGKTTLGKKIGFDWSRGKFKLYSMVFFVFLKLVKPGECIEDVILKQNSELEGLGVSPAKLRKILDRFSDRCLLILDGLDEHGLGLNVDVLKIIRNEKMLDCGIVVSSRPHSTREVETYFQTVIRVDGFNRQEAERFVSNFFRDKQKIEKIMKFTPSDSIEEIPIQKCPILLSFFCFLVAEQEIDLQDTAISIGDIYTRLVKCLYKKFTIRKDIKFKLDDFLQVLKSVAKLALATLKSNNPLLEKSEVLSVVGKDAFEYGLFAGHEDFRLIGDLTADIYVTYPHRSLEEFFGSFGFCQALSEGNSVEEILGTNSRNSLLLVNPLFLKFTLWFLSITDFDFQQRDECYAKITSYVATHIDDVEFDPEETREKYPAFDVLSSATPTDDLKVNFFRDTFAKCKNIKVLRIRSGVGLVTWTFMKEVDMVLKLINRDFLNNLTKITVGDLEPRDTDDHALTLAIDSEYTDALQVLNLLLHDRNLSHRNPQVYLRLGFDDEDQFDVIKIMAKEVKELCKYIKELRFKYTPSGLLLDEASTNFTLKASGKFPYCPVFRHLMVKRGHIDGSVPSAFREALRDGKLPNFRSVDLYNCCGQISPTDWPKEVELYVDDKYGDTKYCSICPPQKKDGEK